MPGKPSSKEVHLLRVPKLANPAQQYLLDCWRSMLLCLHPWVDCQIIHVARHRSVARRYIFRVCQNWQTQQQYLQDCWRSMLLRLSPWVDCQITRVARHRSAARRYICHVYQNSPAAAAAAASLELMETYVVAFAPMG